MQVHGELWIPFMLRMLIILIAILSKMLSLTLFIQKPSFENEMGEGIKKLFIYRSLSLDLVFFLFSFNDIIEINGGVNWFYLFVVIFI